MPNTPDNPFNPSPAPQDKGPWLYSGTPQSQPAYVPPPANPMPVANVSPTAPPPPRPVTPALPRPLEKPPQKSDDASLASIIDTIEAIIIALILALSFRAFVVEAFVIPTGSMAPTLLGAHFNVICPKCGYVFTKEARLEQQYGYNPTQHRFEILNVGSRAELSNNTVIPSDLSETRNGAITCPNCQFAIDPSQLPQRLPSRIAHDARGDTERSVSFAWANNGDRILVLKYLYALMEPHRFDVIVFKEPMNARDNYIKRLIGLPGETVEIVDGDVYISPPGKNAETDRLIARKPAFIQKGLWQLVYDNDYYPTDAGSQRSDGNTWTNPWSGADATANSWEIRGPVFRYAAPTPGATQFNVRDPYTFNILGYNNDATRIYTPSRNRNLFRATDLRLETVWTPDDAAGASISLSVGQSRNLFRADWNSTGLTLQHYNPQTRLFESVEARTTAQVPAPAAGRGYHVALDNVDRTIRVFINDKLVLEHETPWNVQQAKDESNEQRSTVETSSKPELRINVGGACTLAHTKLFRDLYYTQTNDNVSEDPLTANADHPLTLGPDEFFAMGDNSRLSEDGRLWPTVYPALDDLGTRRGIVPRRYLLGKAFLVYWPAGFRPLPDSGIPGLSTLPIIPNTGDIRLIR